MYTFIYNTCSYSFPIRTDAYFVCVLSILLREVIHKRVHTPPRTNFNDCIYVFLVNRNQLLGYAVLVILLVIPRYKKKYYVIFIQ